MESTQTQAQQWRAALSTRSSSCSITGRPANSRGVSVPAGCSRHAGYLGIVSAVTSSLFHSSTWSAVVCGGNLHGTSVPAGCPCNAGYPGAVSAGTSDLLYTSSDSTVACPSNSRVPSVPGGGEVQCKFLSGGPSSDKQPVRFQRMFYSGLPCEFSQAQRARWMLMQGKALSRSLGIDDNCKVHRYPSARLLIPPPHATSVVKGSRCGS